MIGIRKDKEQSINVWVTFSDLFAGFLLIVLVMFASFYQKFKPETVNLEKQYGQAVLQSIEINRIINEKVIEYLSKKPKYTQLVESLRAKDIKDPLIIPSDSIFERNQYEIRDPEKIELLTVVVDALKDALKDERVQKQQENIRIIIEGHTDQSKPLDGPLDKIIRYNWDLSGQRASSVLVFFQNQGINETEFKVRLLTSGLADTQPIISTDPNSPKNRRIVIRLEPDLEKIRRDFKKQHQEL